MIDGLYGPPKVVFYMDLNSGADQAVYYLFLTTIILGGLSLMIGLFVLLTSKEDDWNVNMRDIDSNNESERVNMIHTLIPRLPTLSTDLSAQTITEK